jgi:hypothetical protein
VASHLPVICSVLVDTMDSESEMDDLTTIEYASPQPQKQAVISPRGMFFLLLPVALFGMEIIADSAISNIASDDRDYAGWL